MPEDSLQHHGILKQRWGFRRFQNKDGTLTEAGKARYGKKSKSAQSEPARMETPEEKHARLTKSTDAADIYKNIDLLTNAELTAAIQRINSKNTLAMLARQQNPDTLRRAYKKIDKAVEFANKMNDVYQITQKPVVKAMTKKLFDSIDTAAGKQKQKKQ